MSGRSGAACSGVAARDDQFGGLSWAAPLATAPWGSAGGRQSVDESKRRDSDNAKSASPSCLAPRASSVHRHNCPIVVVVNRSCRAEGFFRFCRCWRPCGMGGSADRRCAAIRFNAQRTCNARREAWPWSLAPWPYVETALRRLPRGRRCRGQRFRRRPLTKTLFRTRPSNCCGNPSHRWWQGRQ